MYIYSVFYGLLSANKIFNQSIQSITNQTYLLHIKLEALGERRPPWPREIITAILPAVKMLSHDIERLTLKILDHYLHHDLVMLQLSWCFFAPLLILEDQDHHQNLMLFVQPRSPP